MEYFDLNPSMPTVSAFVQQRNKVNYYVVKILFLLCYNKNEVIDSLFCFQK